MSGGKFSETKALIRLFLGTFSVLGLIAAINVAIILDSVGHEVLQPLTRNIASVDLEENPQPVIVKAPIWRVSCQSWSDKLVFRTKAESARLEFNQCPEIHSLINQANQNSGDLFNLKSGPITSDFISLDEGLNKIQVLVGKATKTIEITREPLAPLINDKEL